MVDEVNRRQTKIRIQDEFRQIVLLEEIKGSGREIWLVENTSRRMGIDTGKDTLVHIDQILQRTLEQMTTKFGRPGVPSDDTGRKT